MAESAEGYAPRRAMNTPNFKAVLQDVRAVQAEEAEQQRSIDERLRPLGWTVEGTIGADRRIYWRDMYDVPVCKVDAYPAGMVKRDPITGRKSPARIVDSAAAASLADMIALCVNTHDALIEALLEALPELKEGFARAMVIRALEMARAGSGLSDEDLAQADEYLGRGFDYRDFDSRR